jgi:DhnA family fructose-bisphosphate aldolase class Ia
MSGKVIRLQRLFRLPGGRALMVPIDHALSMGAVPGLDDPSAVVRAAAEAGATGVIGHRGGLAEAVGRLGAPRVDGLALVLHLSAATTLSSEPARQEVVCTVEEAVRRGADAVSVQLNFGCGREAAMLRGLARVVRDADRFGLPVVVMAYARDARGTIDFTPERVVHAARAAAELGADAIKVPFAGAETIAAMARIIPVPLLVAGGGKATRAAVLGACHASLAAGARGLCVGRNVFQSADPTAILTELHDLVCGDGTPARIASARARWRRDA